ncbi:MAG: HAMP domain-containing histidine kinase [Armatimonadetes bacterium]|nr:HAMP domain-containing histidine kinase [Armatimonadota bacterium]MDE2206972.1 HAMP domain-containing histidine kinase [Armatimonadota bacterium]
MKRETGCHCASEPLRSAILLAWRAAARRRLRHIDPELLCRNGEISACAEMTLEQMLRWNHAEPNGEHVDEFAEPASTWAALKLPWTDVRALIELLEEASVTALDPADLTGKDGKRCARRFKSLAATAANSRLRAVEADLHQRSQESMALEQCIERFLASASHDLRTPLTAIIGFAELLSDGEYEPLNASQAAAVSNIENSAQNLLEAANNLLVTLQYRAGTLRMHPQAVALDTLLQHLCSTLAPRAERRAVRLELSSPGGSPVVNCDESLLRHSLHQLILLAVRTAEPGSTIRITTTIRERGVVVDLQCTGLHLPPEIVRLLEIQVNTVDSVVDQGYEAWLAGIPLAQRFLSLIGGRLNICAHSEDGAWFTLVLPLPEVQITSEITGCPLAT